MKPATAGGILLAHRHDAVEAAAYRDMVAAAPPAVRSRLGLQAREVAGATLLVAPGLPVTIFNRVMGLGNPVPATGRDLEEISRIYRDEGVRSWWVHATPGPNFDALCGLLAEGGFTLPARKAWAKMWREAAPPPAASTIARLERAGPSDANPVGEVLGTAFGMPPDGIAWFASLVGRPGWTTWLARLGGRVVGAGMLHLQGDVGWLGAGGVHPDARRAHVHRALMAARVAEAHRHGCAHVATETGEPAADEPNPSLRNMEACGFRKLVTRLNFAAPAA
ncbi:MAG TPA: GNAT family N-acetyltransferase [Burkholderiales bacterium]|nr:GNAT family N-acetyltransferase [Burkholderiales bacterium]